MNLREELTAIYERRGELTPAIALEESTPVGAPMHDQFTWDNNKAGHEYRLIEAHRLIQSVRVQHVSSNGPVTVRAFLAMPRPHTPQPTYEPVGVVMADPIKREVVLRAMRREWETLQARYGDLVEFSEMVLSSLVPA